MKNCIELLLSSIALLLSSQNIYAQKIDMSDITYSNAHNEVKEWKAFMKDINEPDLEKSKREAYRFCCEDMYIFTLLVNDDGTAVLDSKTVMRKGVVLINGNDTGLAPESEIFKTTKQQLTKEQCLTFKKLVNDYYNWPDSDSCLPAPTISNNLAYSFEAMSKEQDKTIVSYHWKQFACLHSGNFRSVYNFLVNNSALFNEAMKKELLD